MHKEIQVDKDFTFEFKFFDKSGQLIPTASTVTIFNNGGTSLQTGSGTIDSEGTITYTFLAANNIDVDINFKVNVAYTVASVVKEHNILFDAVKHPINNLITEKDLFIHVRELRDKQFTRNGGTSANGTTTTFVDDKLSIDIDGDWVGGRGELLLDTGSQEFVVSAFTKATGTVTFTPAADEAVAIKSNYIIRESYQSIINEAFSIVRKDIRKKIGIMSNYINEDVIKLLIIYKAIEIIAIGKVEITDDKWDFRSKKFGEMYNTELSGFFEPYDTSRDGNISDWEDEDRPTASTISISDFHGRQ